MLFQPGLLAEAGGRDLQKLVEGSVKLRKAGKPALEGDLRDRSFRGKQQGLGITHPGQRDIVRQGKAGDALELVGQIIATDEKFPGNRFQGQFFRIMTVDKGSNVVYLIGDAVQIRTVGIHVFIAVQIDYTQKFYKFIVDGQIRQFVGGLRQIIDVVQLLQHGLFRAFFEAVDGAFSRKNTVYMLHTAFKLGDHGRDDELNDQPLAGIPFGVGGLVQQSRTQSYNIAAPKIIPYAVYEMAGLFVQKNAYLVKLVEVLEFHIDGIGALIIIKKVI